jgi:hypothetical protein
LKAATKAKAADAAVVAVAVAATVTGVASAMKGSQTCQA